MIRRVLLHPVTEVVVAVLLASVLLAAIKSGQAPLAVAVGVFLAAQLVNVWAILRWLARVEPGYELLLRRLREVLKQTPAGERLLARSGSWLAVHVAGGVWITRAPGESLAEARRELMAGAPVSTMQRETYLLRGPSRLYRLTEVVPTMRGADGRLVPPPVEVYSRRLGYPVERSLWRIWRYNLIGSYVPMPELAELIAELETAQPMPG